MEDHLQDRAQPSAYQDFAQFGHAGVLAGIVGGNEQVALQHLKIDGMALGNEIFGRGGFGVLADQFQGVRVAVA